MAWNLSFISEDEFSQHVLHTIEKYGEKLKPYTLAQFNQNLIDPVKLIFDHSLQQSSWEEIIANEIYRQRDKSNNNEIGYFHQNIFKYFRNCSVPTEGWDIIFTGDKDIELPDGAKVKRIYVELKNKHNTMNSSSAQKTYMRMQHQVGNEPDAACFLVEVIAKKSQNITWVTTVDKMKLSNNRIRRVSIDKFYEIVTGEADAFYKVVSVLPEVINKLLEQHQFLKAGKDTVLDELYALTHQADTIEQNQQNLILTALLLLGFGSYQGFKK